MCSVDLVTLSVISLGKVCFDSLPGGPLSWRGGRGSLGFGPLAAAASLGKEVEVLKKQGREEHIVFGLLFPS